MTRYQARYHDVALIALCRRNLRPKSMGPRLFREWGSNRARYPCGT
jgi:hypothetical protein